MFDNSRKRTKVFYHIPKTSGTNLVAEIENNYRNCKKVTYYRGKDHTGFVYKYYDDDDLRFVTGHQEYKSAFEIDDPLFFIMIRNPVERIISHFVMNKYHGIVDEKCTLEEVFLKNPDKYLTDDALEKDLKYAGIFPLSYPFENSFWVRNFYTLALSEYSFTGDISTKQSRTNNIIQHLKDNKLRFNFEEKEVTVDVVVGITEQYEQSKKLFNKLFGWNLKESEFSWKRKYNASEELIDAMKFYNQQDYEIYDQAVKTFKAQLDFYNFK